jgi:hypothetical protein
LNAGPPGTVVLEQAFRIAEEHDSAAVLNHCPVLGIGTVVVGQILFEEKSSGFGTYVRTSVGGSETESRNQTYDFKRCAAQGS